MSIKFKTIQKGNPQNTAIPAKFYAQAAIDEEITFEELIDTVANNSKMSYADCYRVLLNLEDTLTKELQNGKAIRLGGIGSFKIGIGSNGFATEKQVTATTINSAKINFLPGKGLKKMLKILTYRKVKS